MERARALARTGVVPLPDGGRGWRCTFHELGIGVLPVDIEFEDGAPTQVVMTQGPFKIIRDVESSSEREMIAYDELNF